MSEEQNIEESQEDSKPERPKEEANENISQEQTIEQPQTTNSKLQTENMEVHHHPDLHHRKKHFKEYFLEFLMIFLAVTLGFFAENIREHLSDRSKEKQYITSLIQDMQSDTAFLQLSINTLIPYHLKWLDSTVILMQSFDINGKDRLIYQAFMIATAWTYDYHPTERTLSQLHSEGFHLIQNEEAAKAISKLEDLYKLLIPNAAKLENMQLDIDESAYSFADRNVSDKLALIGFHNFPFVNLKLSDVPASAVINTENKEAIKNYIDTLKKYSFYLALDEKDGDVIVLNEITKTISILKKEYHLQ
jgi:hypothetical protein